MPGIGPVLAAVFVAEIGDVHRFAGPAQLCSWAGLTPRHRESDTVVHRGHITKQGSKLVRWAAIEAIQRHPDGAEDRRRPATRLEPRRGKNIAKVAAARKLLTLVYYGLRDGHIRCPGPTRRERRSGAARRRGRGWSDPHPRVARSTTLIDPHLAAAVTTPCHQPSHLRDTFCTNGFRRQRVSVAKE